MKKIFIILAVVLSVTVAFSAAAGFPKVIVQGADGETEYEFSGNELKSRFFPDFIRWAIEDSGKTYGKDAVLCLGSSSMRMWKTIHKDLSPVEIIHRGFGGSTMREVVAFGRFFAKYNVGRIVIYEGDNDMMGSGTPEQFYRNCVEFVKVIRETNNETEFFFISPKPSVSRWKFKDKFIKGGELLKKMCAEDDKLHYIDVWTSMCDENKEVKKDIFLKDNLHMNSKGYKIWTDVVKPMLVKDK